jgi:putative tricarboxylic transport membrane protein
MQQARKWAAALSAAVALGAAPTALAQWTPTHPVDVIVHTGPGGGNDVLARAIANMAEKEHLLPVRMNVLNKPGGAGGGGAGGGGG